MKKLIEVFLPLIISLSLFAESPAIVIHGGAGWFSNMSPDAVSYTHLTLPTIAGV